MASTERELLSNLLNKFTKSLPVGMIEDVLLLLSVYVRKDQYL